MATYAVLVDWDNNLSYGGANEDVTLRVLGDRGVSMERGRDQLRELSPPMAGRLEFTLDNRSRDYSVKNASSPVYAQLVPGHRVRVTGDAYYLATCWLDDLPQQPGIGDKAVSFPCLGQLSRLVGKTISTAMYENITTDVAIGAILDAAGFLPTERVLDIGQTTLAWWWLEQADAFAALRELLNAEGPGAALYERGDGAIIFENRHYRLLTTRSTTSQGTFRDSGASPWFREPYEFQPNLKNVINHAEIAVNVRTPATLAEIWALGANLVLAASSTIKLQVKAASGDPFRGAIAPLLTTDYTLIAGTVSSMTLDRTSGLSATLTIVAGAGGATITGLRLRAVLLPATTVRVTNTVDTSTSQTKYGVRTWAEPVWPEIDLNLAQELVNAIVTAYQTPRASARITIEGADATMLGHCLAREISDRVTVIEAQTGLNAAMHIEHIRHDLGPRARHVTTLGLEEVAAVASPGLWGSGLWNTATWGF